MIISKQLANALYYASELNGEHTEIYCDVCGEYRIINVFHRLCECPGCGQVLHYLEGHKLGDSIECSVAL